MIDTKNRTMLVDGDLLAFMCSVSMEEAIKWDDDIWTLHASESKSIDNLANTIDSYQQMLLCDNVVIALSSKTNFRKELSPLYKFNRKNQRKPLTYSPLKDWFRNNFKTYEFPYLEGDDTLGILATSDKFVQGEKIILTKDKDLRTIPGTVWFMQGHDYEIISEEDADYFHMMQTLTGDTTDGYPGCPSVGKVTAEKILKDHKGNFEAMWEAVVKRYEMMKLDKKFALLQARLARIIRANEYNFERERPLLWQPKLKTS
tara:strand:+ start:1112 stop:1888 length:777 start_codon:yes stop_codon:yes gene_type:complete